MFWGGCEAQFTPRPLGPMQDMAYALDTKLVDLFGKGVAPSQMFPALVNALGEDHSSKILIFEDVHWADHGTLDLVKYLGRRIGILPALIVLTYRSDEVSEALRQVLGDLPSHAVARLTLAPLSPDGVMALARGADRSSEGLHRATGGSRNVQRECRNEAAFWPLPDRAQCGRIRRVRSLEDAIVSRGTVSRQSVVARRTTTEH